MPESAIKFLTYEASKRAFARYYDHVDSASDISNASRFMSGGLGGIVSQASIYWIETLKTQVMSTAGTKDAKVGMQLTLSTASRMWQSDGIRSFHRGLTWAVVGVFPYSGIDMALYELFKRKYIRFHDGDDLGVLASLTFGAASGGIGATCVYPLCVSALLVSHARSNLVRTRLQAQGTPSHPQRYNGIRDVVAQTYSREGVRGFYRGLSVKCVFPSPGQLTHAVLRRSCPAWRSAGHATKRRRRFLRLRNRFGRVNAGDGCQSCITTDRPHD